jgi:vitamin B12 transporter
MKYSLGATYIVCLSLIRTTALFCSEDDTTSHYVAKEVVVTATRLPMNENVSSSSVTVLDHAQLEQTGSASVASAIDQSAGVFIKDYGGASGIKLISQRGLGSEHTVILLNGQRISLFQNGLVDLGMLPTDDLQRIEIIRGGQSAVFGADAVAGAINLVTRPVSLESEIGATTTIGSFGSRKGNVYGGTSIGGVGISGGYSQEHSDQDFPFLFHNGNLTYTLHRSDADIDDRFGYLQAATAVGDSGDLSMFASSYGSDRGAGGQIVGPSTVSHARQTDLDDIAQGALQFPFSSSTMMYSNLQLQHYYERYQDPDLVVGRIPVDDYFVNREIRFEPRIEHAINDRFLFTTGIEMAHVEADGNSLPQTEVRNQFSVYGASENTLVSTEGPIEKIMAFPALRYDYFSSLPSSLSPQLGIVTQFSGASFGLLKDIAPILRLNAGQNFRVPTFNELYYSGQGGRGNPSLKPERSTNLDAGGGVSFYAEGEHSIQVSYYHIVMKDRILWLPAGNLGTVPENIAKIRSEGIELSYEAELFDDAVRFGANYTNGSSIKISKDSPEDPSFDKQLIYIPQEMGNVSCTISQKFEKTIVQELDLTALNQYVGYRFYSEDNTEFLPSYSLTNLILSGHLDIEGVKFLANGEIENIFNKDYQVIIGYPMPMRSYHLTIGVEY